MRIQSVAFSNDGVQISYIEEKDLHRGSGVVYIHTVEVPHEVLDQALLDELIDAAQSIVEEARVIARKPEDSFVADR